MIARGEVWAADLGPVLRPVIVVSRETAIPVLSRLVCVAVTKTLRGHPAEVELSDRHGVQEPSAANCDWVMTLPKHRLKRRLGALDHSALRRLDAALRVALELDRPG